MNINAVVRDRLRAGRLNGTRVRSVNFLGGDNYGFHAGIWRLVAVWLIGLLLRPAMKSQEVEAGT